MTSTVFAKDTAIILKFCWVLGMLDLNNKGGKYKIYSGCFLTGFATSYVLLVFINYPGETGSQLKTQIDLAKDITSAILVLSLFLSLLCTVVPLVFWYSKLYQKFQNAVAIFDIWFKYKSHDHSYGIFLFFLLETVSYVILHTIIKNDQPVNIIAKAFVGQLIISLLLGTSFYLRLYLTIKVWKRFEVINKHLKLLLSKKPYQIEDGLVTSKNKNMEELHKNKLWKVTGIHNLMCDALDMLNKMVGFSLVSDVVYSIIFVLKNTINVIFPPDEGIVYARSISLLTIFNICVSMSPVIFQGFVIQT